MPDVPSWWEFLLLALAAWRIFRLIAEDEILNRPRRWVLNLDPDWEEGEDPNDDYRFEWGAFLTCPWCAGAWVSFGWYAFWIWQPHATLVLATFFALSAATGLIATNLDK